MPATDTLAAALAVVGALGIIIATGGYLVSSALRRARASVEAPCEPAPVE